MKPATSHVLAVGLAIATVLFLVLAVGALGIIGDGGREDRMYAGVLAVGLIGTVVSRLRAPGMALTLAAMAGTQVLVAAIALVAGLPDDVSVVDLLGLTAMYAGLFGLSALLFRRAARPLVGSLRWSSSERQRAYRDPSRPHGG